MSSVIHQLPVLDHPAAPARPPWDKLLNDDVLRLIFEACVERASMQPEKLHMAFILSVVSQRWRTLACSSPRVWRHISLDGHGKQHTQSRQTTICLSHSGILPSIVHIDMRPPPAVPRSRSNPFKLLGNGRIRVDALMVPFLHHSGGIQELSFVNASFGPMAEFMKMLERQPIPKLAALTIQRDTSELPAPEPLNSLIPASAPAPLNLCDPEFASSIRRLSLVGARVDWGRVSVRNLTRLTLARFGVREKMTLEQLRDLLVESRNTLQYLDLEGILESAGDTAPVAEDVDEGDPEALELGELADEFSDEELSDEEGNESDADGAFDFDAQLESWFDDEEPSEIATERTSESPYPPSDEEIEINIYEGNTSDIDDTESLRPLTADESDVAQFKQYISTSDAIHFPALTELRVGFSKSLEAIRMVSLIAAPNLRRLTLTDISNIVGSDNVMIHASQYHCCGSFLKYLLADRPLPLEQLEHLRLEAIHYQEVDPLLTEVVSLCRRLRSLSVVGSSLDVLSSILRRNSYTDAKHPSTTTPNLESLHAHIWSVRPLMRFLAEQQATLREGGRHFDMLRALVVDCDALESGGERLRGVRPCNERSAQKWFQGQGLARQVSIRQLPMRASLSLDQRF